MSRPWDLRLGRWQDVLADVEMVDAVITDPPYSERTHTGHDAGVRTSRHASETKRGARGWPRNGQTPDPFRERRTIAYKPWTAADVDEFVDAWAPRNRGWFVCLSDSELCGAYRAAYERNGLTGFHPVPVLIPGMTVRMSGDGPSSWCVYANVGRPKALHKWGTLRGYLGPFPLGVRERQASAVAGAKPLAAMLAAVDDYTRPGDLVCDPCAGGATTLLAASIEGRRSIGAEMDPETYAKARKRLEAGYTPTFDFGEEAAR